MGRAFAGRKKLYNYVQGKQDKRESAYVCQLTRAAPFDGPGMHAVRSHGPGCVVAVGKSVGVWAAAR